MDFSVMVFPLWLFLMFWIGVSGALGLTTKKERLCAIVMVDVIATLVSIQAFFEAAHWWSHLIWSLLFYVNQKSMRNNYKRWKNTDDDDDWKQRRKSWAKSHLPKPVVRTIPQPV